VVPRSGKDAEGNLGKGKQNHLYPIVSKLVLLDSFFLQKTKASFYLQMAAMHVSVSSANSSMF